MTDTEAPPARRGRPRSEATQALDSQVLELITNAGTAGIKRNDIVAHFETTGLAVKASLVYLSLFRLAKAEAIVRGKVNGAHTWYTTAYAPAA